MGIKNTVVNSQNYQLYLSNDALALPTDKLNELKNGIVSFLLKKDFITQAFRMDKVQDAPLPTPLREMVVNGYTQKRSGDIQFIVKPAYYDGGSKGTTHGMWNPYDSHIPLLFFGWGIKPGRDTDNAYMTDIAPTIASMLRIQMPNANIGVSLESRLKK